MITQLRGRLLDQRPPALILDVGGVGYELDAPLSTHEQLPERGQEVTLHTHLSVREDGFTLYGFCNRNERDLFRRLIRISGVGPKLALALLSGLDGRELIRCVRDDDAKRLTAIPGVGRKTAERLIVELRDRLEGLGWSADAAAVDGASAADDATASFPGSSEFEQAVDGLQALGYKPAEAVRMARSVATDEMSCETIIRRALQRSLAGRSG
ncbi:Holliday junction branch migration protein RuvA [Halorhodospira abdelmalekii]|uniref:Holliday junction branch migration protein RuvA n=1 Tax=Halorhodospira abdelmalekii TaxID=421629 RepID=UPI001904E9FF|nr:Holliday junction branch migration protein RuvA [Halorhodospira abdelmalekii]MBK1734114.1 Holliday junction branch migration protein RuvA [Halorhodospira abdelmalekii]